MTQKVRAHYDGKVIVPDEPVDWPVGEPLQLELTSLVSKNGGSESWLKRAEAFGLIGCSEEGPADLSTNKRYFEGFGNG